MEINLKAPPHSSKRPHKLEVELHVILSWVFLKNSKVNTPGILHAHVTVALFTNSQYATRLCAHQEMNESR